MGADEEATDDEDEVTPDETSDPRSFRPTMQGRPDLEMNAFGWILFSVLVILLIPLLPAILLAIVVSKLLGFGGRQRLSWG